MKYQKLTFSGAKIQLFFEIAKFISRKMRKIAKFIINDMRRIAFFLKNFEKYVYHYRSMKQKMQIIS